MPRATRSSGRGCRSTPAPSVRAATPATLSGVANRRARRRCRRLLLGTVPPRVPPVSLGYRRTAAPASARADLSMAGLARSGKGLVTRSSGSRTGHAGDPDRLANVLARSFAHSAARLSLPRQWADACCLRLLRAAGKRGVLEFAL